MVVKGNKGGVAIRFNVYHSSMCFVNCQLAASMEDVDKRNQASNILCVHMYACGSDCSNRVNCCSCTDVRKVWH